MARPGFVLEVDDRTPALVVPSGDAVRLERLPLGSRVIYPVDSLPAVPDVREAIEVALDGPLDSAPLGERLHSGMRLTLVVDDLTRPAPKLAVPDVRGLVAEAVLTRAAAAGVDDVAVIFGRGLNRRMTAEEQERTVGERVYRSFVAEGRLSDHDAEDAEQLRVITDEVSVSTRVADSDLVVHIHLATDPREEPGAALVAGIGSVATIGALRQDAATVTGAVLDAVPTFAVDVVLDNDTFPEALSFLTKREWEWKLKERAVWYALRNGLDLAPKGLRRRFVTSADAAYAPTLISAGDPRAVHAASRQQLSIQRRVEVSGQADVGIVGVSAVTPYSIDSITNPVLAAWAGLAGLFGAHTGTPFVRDGGALIVFHPLTQQFSPLHHPSYVDFFSDVLPTTTDAERIATDVEPKFATDPWYAHLYRTGYAFHGVHPLQRWYELSAATASLGDIVFVGADRTSAERLGVRAASTLADALEIVSASVGRTPRISYLHAPPHIEVDVR